MNKLLRSLFASLAGLLVSQVCWSEDLLTKVTNSRQITVATEARYAPFEYVEGGKIVGYDIDLLQHVLASSLPGVQYKMLDLPFQGLLPGLDAKRFDMIIAAVTANKERMNHFAFSLPIAEATIGVLLRADSAARLKTPADLNGKTVGAQIGSVQTDALRALDQRLKEGGGAGLKEIKQYVAYDEAYADLATGRLDAVAQSLSNLGPLMKSRPGVFAVMEQTIGPKSYFAWVARKDADSAALLKAINAGIARANQDGTMEQLQLKWFGISMDLPADAMPEPAL